MEDKKMVIDKTQMASLTVRDKEIIKEINNNKNAEFEKRITWLELKNKEYEGKFNELFKMVGNPHPMKKKEE